MKTLLSEQDRAEVIGRVASIQLDTPRRWGRMSPNQMVCHLTDSFLACLGERGAGDVSNPFTRSVLRFVAITLPMHWPHGVKTRPEVDQEVGGTPPTGLDPDLERLRATAERFVAELDPGAMRHPLFGSMSAAEWGRWGYRHMDHHARQFGL